jgi:circadian clock protein KaiB
MEETPRNRFVIEGKLVLQLYVSGMSSKSMEAIENIKRLCDEHLNGAFQLEIIDLYKNPEAASEQQIIFSPSLIKQLPLPKKNPDRNFCRYRKSNKGFRHKNKRIMMGKASSESLLLRVEELENRLAEAEQLIEAIKAAK